MRLDLLLVQKKMAHSRSHAQDLIAAGQVFHVAGERRIPLKKASQDFPEGTELEVVNGPANQFVSRAGHKLEGALRRTELAVGGLIMLDVGTSTGGFADCLLQRGAAAVTGVDVGHGQSHPQLLKNERFRLLEGVNARALSRNAEFKAQAPAALYDGVVMDVSFISITLILPELAHFLKPDGFLLSLVKPQFEVGAEGLGKGGIVKEVALYSAVEERVKAVCLSSGFVVKDYFESSLEGKEGNREFFIFARKPGAAPTARSPRA